MAMEFIDGFDYLTAANGILKWDTFAGSLVTGVYGKGKAIGGACSGTKSLVANDTTGFQCFHLYTGTRPSGNTGGFCSFFDAATTQCDLRMNNLGQLFFTRNGTSIGAAGAALAPNRVYWIEVKVTISTTVGEASVQINGSAYLTQTNLNTQATGNASFNKVGFAGNFTGDQTQYFDSYHFFNNTAGSGNDPSNFFGEHLIDTELANVVGSNTTWSRGGTNTGNNFSQVNEANEDADITYVFSSTVNQIDSYGFVNLSETTGTIAIVAVNTIDRVDDGMIHVMDHFVLHSGSSVLSPGINPAAGYSNHQSLFALDPNTSAAFTVAGRNATEFGYKFIS